MSLPRVLLLEDSQADYQRLLAEQCPQLPLAFDSRQAADCPVWLGEPQLFAPLLRQGLRPDWLQSTWAGITPLLADDLPRDYRLCRAVGVFGQLMAEYVLGYLLARRRRLFERAASQRRGHWDGQLPHSLHGLRLLIVGTGDIGTAVAGFLQPFGIVLRGIARQPRPIAPFAEVHGMAALAEQAGWADCLLNLLPDTPQTRDLYDAALFARMRPGSQFINCGRGVAVVDADLLAALRDGPLAEAVIDVCREEPLPAGHPFWQADNLHLTGHSSAPTDPALLVGLFLDNLQRARSGEPLRGLVDFARGY